MIECVFLQPIGLDRVWYRRYSNEQCSSMHSYHDAMVYLHDVPADSVIGRSEKNRDTSRDEGKWPDKCNCGYEFTRNDQYQFFVLELYTRPDGSWVVLRNGSHYGNLELRPGDMWDAYWNPTKGYDGKSLSVVCPDGKEWWIDGRANNCEMKEDNVHRCWTREGEPPAITVGKFTSNGQTTCGAGGGSIATKTYHGFLQGGKFT